MRMVVLTLLACLAPGTSMASTPALVSPLVAPGREVFAAPPPRDALPPHSTGFIAATGFTAGAALADGRLVFAHGVEEIVDGQLTGRVEVLRLLRDGKVDTSFGDRGVAGYTIPYLPPPAFESPGPLQLLDRGAGRLLLVAPNPRTPDLPPDIELVALMADGRTDPSFGAGGATDTGVRFSGDAPVSIAPDGSLLVAGATGPPPVLADDHLVTELHASVARLHTDGTPDASFGTDGIATSAASPSNGWRAIALASGAIALTGSVGPGVNGITRLRADGSPDPTFNGGNPIALNGFPSGAFVQRSDLSLDVPVSPGYAPGQVTVRRISSAGVLAPAPVLQAPGDTGDLIATADGGELLIATASHNTTTTTLAVQQLGADAAPGPLLSSVAPFAGGRATTFEALFRYSQPSLNQHDFDPGHPFQAPGGRIVFPGAVVVAQPSGEQDTEQVNPAVAVVTSALKPDSSFGGPATPAALHVTVPPQRVTVTWTPRAHIAPALTIRARTSGPGLATVQVRSQGRLIARQTVAVWTAGSQSIPVLLTRNGLRRLRHAGHPLQVRASVRFRSLTGLTAAATSRPGTLGLGTIRCRACDTAPTSR